MNRNQIYFVIFTLVFVYITVRASLLGITYDEAWTIISFVPLNILNIFLFNPCDANNQILNTLLIKGLFVFGNHSILTARLPNVLAFVVYAFFTYRIAKGFLNHYLGITLFIILLCNPFVLDFFSLARGYGLAMALQMGSLFYLLEFCKSNKLTNYSFSLLFAALAVLSNFTFLYFFLAIFGVGNIISLIMNKWKMDYLKVLVTGVLFTLLLALLIYIPMTKLIINERLYYGGNIGFYQDTLLSLFSFSLYHPYDLHLGRIVLNGFLLACGIIAVFTVFNRGKRSLELLTGKTAVILLLTGIIILATLLNHYISGTFYLTDRTALMFFPLMMCVIIFLADYVNHTALLIPVRIIVTVICVLSLLNFGINANFTKTILWPFDAHTESILSRINSIGKSENTIKTIDFSWPLESSVHYYLQKNNYSNLSCVKDANDRETLNLQSDYYIYYGKSQEKVGFNADKQLVLAIDKDTAWSYSSEDTYVFTNLDKNKGDGN
jgi:hypothetical protein